MAYIHFLLCYGLLLKNINLIKEKQLYKVENTDEKKEDLEHITITDNMK
jgi:hypothetical protein